MLAIEANVTYAAFGMHSKTTLELCLAGIVPGGRGMLLGIGLKNRISETQYRRSMLAVIVMVSLAAIVRYFV